MFNKSHAKCPRYVEHGGEQTFRPPYMNRGARWQLSGLTLILLSNQVQKFGKPVENKYL